MTEKTEHTEEYGQTAALDEASEKERHSYTASSYEDYLKAQYKASKDGTEGKKTAPEQEPSDVSEAGGQNEEPQPRKKKKRKRRKKHYFLRILVLIGLIAGAAEFVTSDYFAVTEINVSGNRYFTSSQIIEMSGMSTGENILFGIKTEPAKKALLEDPYIKLAAVKKVLRGTVEISVEERAEYAMIPLEDKYVIIDEEGMVLRISDGDVPKLPLLQGLTLKDAQTGVSLDVEQAYLLTDVLELLKAMNSNDLYFKEIYFSTVVVRAFIYDDFYIEGSPSNITASMAQIRLLVNELYRDNIQYGVVKVGSDGYLAYSPQYE